MRKHTVLTISDKGRDSGKSYLVLEKPAFEAEKWAFRALMALARSGVDVPDEVMQAPAVGLMLVGIEAFKRMPFEEAEPLLDEMLECVSFVPDTTRTDPQTSRPLCRPLRRDADDGDIAEVSTLLRLRGEALELHLGFSVTAALSDLAAVVTSSQRNTPTSPEPAQQSSEPVKPA